jgi:alpha-galactosidase
VPRIAFVGAGSVEFTKTLVADLLAYPELRDRVELVLHDVDRRRLGVAEAIVRAVREARGAGAGVRVTLDRREALAGADYVLFTVQVGGHDATLRDYEIPLRHGIRSTIGDTIGIGGVFRALRTFPVICATAREVAELAPDAWLLNYTNPMAMLCWAAYAGTPLERVVGLCHSVQGTARQLARRLGVDEEDLDYEAAGLNHLAFFLRLRTKDGENLYPRLDAAIAGDPEGLGRTVRAELYRRLGYFPTESSEHAAEYVPWFLGDDELVERFRIPLGEYVRRSEENVARFERTAAAVERGEPLDLAAASTNFERVDRSFQTHTRAKPACAEGGADKRRLGPSQEYAPAIVHALETGDPFRFNGNVRNDGLISNLPDGACVEVPCVADGRGIRPEPVGALPPQLAALDRAYLDVCRLAVAAHLERRRELVFQACAADPGIRGQDVPLDELEAACEELFEAHREFIDA